MFAFESGSPGFKSPLGYFERHKHVPFNLGCVCLERRQKSQNSNWINWMSLTQQDGGRPTEDLKRCSALLFHNDCTPLSLWKCVTWKNNII